MPPADRDAAGSDADDDGALERRVLVHAIAEAEWLAAGEEVRPPSLEQEGFVHLSRPDQIAWVASQRFVDRQDMVLLVVDPGLVAHPVVWEDCEEVGEEFPHVYGPLPRRAVIAVVPYRPGPDGRYAAPDLTGHVTPGA